MDMVTPLVPTETVLVYSREERQMRRTRRKQRNGIEISRNSGDVERPMVGSTINSFDPRDDLEKATGVLSHQIAKELMYRKLRQKDVLRLSDVEGSLPLSSE